MPKLSIRLKWSITATIPHDGRYDSRCHTNVKDRDQGGGCWIFFFLGILRIGFILQILITGVDFSRFEQQHTSEKDKVIELTQFLHCHIRQKELFCLMFKSMAKIYGNDIGCLRGSQKNEH